jgi:hypothetical protein
MKIYDLDLPTRGHGALRKAKIRTLEDAAAKTDEELLALPGVGPETLAALRAAQGKEFFDVVTDADLLERPKLPPMNQEMGWRMREVFRLLAATATPSPALVTVAADIAMAFEQELQRSAGVELELHEGLRVRFKGENWTVRIYLRPGEEKPAGSRVVLLVPE